MALLMFRDEAEKLPGFFASIAPQVDGIVALDHGSVDGSEKLAACEPKVVEVLAYPKDAQYDEGVQQRLLTEAGVRHGADWLLGIDADERLERGAGDRIRARIAEDGGQGSDAYALPVRELWDRRDVFRVDGIWGGKARTSLFRASCDHRFDERPLHAQWASVAGRPFGQHPEIDARIYHLGSLSREDRAERQARQRRRDPDHRWQRIGYDYLTDETGLELRRIGPDRDYEDVISRRQWATHEPQAGFDGGNEPRRVILHHTALPEPALMDGHTAAEASYMRRIEGLHLDRGWAGVGYHFVIMPSGRIFEGRPIWAIGAHAKGHNRDAAGIAFAGNLDEERPQPAALASLEAIRRRLWPGARPIDLVAHRDLIATACPGSFLCEALSLPAAGQRAEAAP